MMAVFSSLPSWILVLLPVGLLVVAVVELFSEGLGDMVVS